MKLINKVKNWYHKRKFIKEYTQWYNTMGNFYVENPDKFIELLNNVKALDIYESSDFLQFFVEWGETSMTYSGTERAEKLDALIEVQKEKGNLPKDFVLI